MKAIVVGAGLAGLVTARTLHRSGWEVTLIEASDGIGGRVRTDVVDGFKLDRGFQVLFTAYPAAKRQLDLEALKLSRFDSGVIVVEGQRWNEIGDPARDLKALFATVLSTVALTSDKLKILRLKRELKSQPSHHTKDVTSIEFLRAYGFSEHFIELFLRGFFGSIFLDRTLGTSCRCLLFDFKMLAEGRAAVPRDGMQAIPDQIAARLPVNAILLNTPALRLERLNGSVVGVQTPNERLEADVVVLAAHSPEVERLSGLEMPKEANSATCLYFHLPYPMYGHKKIVINAYPDAFVSHAVQITNVAPGYAPAPEHLLSASILGAPYLTLEDMADLALADMQRWFPWRGIRDLAPLAAYQVPFAQLAQLPGFWDALPRNRTDTKGLYLAGEYTEASSINGAMISGEKAAAVILKDRSDG
ncbi:MAG TPA: NAD(P)/FAD-dependent oxidoreductase [Chloroflexota bacterium]